MIRGEPHGVNVRARSEAGEVGTAVLPLQTETPGRRCKLTLLQRHPGESRSPIQLKDELKPELNLSRSGYGLSRQNRAGGRLVFKPAEAQIFGKPQVIAIEDVEEFRAELKIAAFRYGEALVH